MKTGKKKAKLFKKRSDFQQYSISSLTVLNCELLKFYGPAQRFSDLRLVQSHRFFYSVLSAKPSCTRRWYHESTWHLHYIEGRGIGCGPAQRGNFAVFSVKNTIFARFWQQFQRITANLRNLWK